MRGAAAPAALISGKYLAFYARDGLAKDTRRVANGTLLQVAIGAALMHPISRVWKGYWQR